MSKKYKNIIWEGRFQPIHKGHLGYIKILLTLSERVWVIVLANECSTNMLHLPIPDFSLYMDKHHGLEKNPFPLWLRYLLVKEAINSELGDDAKRVEVIFGHRWDLDYSFYSQALPSDRIFAIPKRDSDDDLKEQALIQLGEKCVRIDVSDLPKVSATDVRRAIALNQEHEYLLPSTICILKKAEMWDILLIRK